MNLPGCAGGQPGMGLTSREVNGLIRAGDLSTVIVGLPTKVTCCNSSIRGSNVPMLPAYRYLAGAHCTRLPSGTTLLTCASGTSRIRMLPHLNLFGATKPRSDRDANNGETDPRYDSP
jgi:hypothetical protein